MGDSLEFKRLVDSLLHRSESLETSADRDRSSALDALDELSQLSALTERSFAGISAPATRAVAEEAMPAPAATPHAPAPALASRTTSNPASPKARATKPELPPVTLSEKYQDSPALKDQSVLSALLEYHSLHQPARGVKASRAPAAAPVPSAKAPNEGTRKSIQPPQFRPAEIPVIDELQRKDPPKKSIRSSQPTASVLRAKVTRTE